MTPSCTKHLQSVAQLYRVLMELLGIVVLKEAEEVTDNSYVKQKVYFNSP